MTHDCGDGRTARKGGHQGTATTTPCVFPNVRCRLLAYSKNLSCLVSMFGQPAKPQLSVVFHNEDSNNPSTRGLHWNSRPLMCC